MPPQKRLKKKPAFEVLSAEDVYDENNYTDPPEDDLAEIKKLKSRTDVEKYLKEFAYGRIFYPRIVNGRLGANMRVVKFREDGKTYSAFGYVVPRMEVEESEDE